MTNKYLFAGLLDHKFKAIKVNATFSIFTRKKNSNGDVNLTIRNIDLQKRFYIYIYKIIH